MRAKEYRLLEMAVEDGVGYGWRRAHKHVEHPDEQAICFEIQGAVMNEICAWFDFEETEPE